MHEQTNKQTIKEMQEIKWN